MRIRLVLAALVTARGAARAQAPPRPYVEFSYGVSHLVVDDEDRYRTVPSVLLHLGTQPHADRSFMLGMHLGFIGGTFGPPGSNDVCRWAPDGGCLEDFPLAGIIAFTAGGRSLSPSLESLEIMVGPATLWRTEGGTMPGFFVATRVGSLPNKSLGLGLVTQVALARIEDKTVVVGRLAAALRIW